MGSLSAGPIHGRSTQVRQSSFLVVGFSWAQRGSCFSLSPPGEVTGRCLFALVASCLPCRRLHCTNACPSQGFVIWRRFVWYGVNLGARRRYSPRNVSSTRRMMALFRKSQALFASVLLVIVGIVAAREMKDGQDRCPASTLRSTTEFDRIYSILRETAGAPRRLGCNSPHFGIFPYGFCPPLCLSIPRA